MLLDIVSDIDFAIDGIKEHNRFRKIHNSPALKLDRQMCAQAQAFALPAGHTRYPESTQLVTHARNQGENLAMGCSSGDATMSAGAAAKKMVCTVLT